MRGVAMLGFLPQEAILPMILISGLLLILGAQRLAFTILGTGLTLAIAPAILDPVFVLLPTWVTLVLLGSMVWSLLRPSKKKKK
jgi:hypothetical protein